MALLQISPHTGVVKGFDDFWKRVENVLKGEGKQQSPEAGEWLSPTALEVACTHYTSVGKVGARGYLELAGQSS